MRSLVTSIFLYACESWTLTAELHPIRRIRAMEMICYREILHISVLPRDTTHLIQKPCYQRGSLCRDPANIRTTQRPPDHRKETQAEVAWTCLPFIRSGQNHLARHSERGKKTRQTTTKKRWEDNIREWTGLEFAKSQRAFSGEQRQMEKNWL